MGKVECEQTDLDALSYAYGEIANYLGKAVEDLKEVLTPEQIGPLIDAHNRLSGLSTAVFKPTG